MRDSVKYIVYGYIVISLVIMVYLGISVVSGNKAIKRMDYVVDSLRVGMYYIQEDAKKRDSLLGVEISSSLVVIDQLSGIRCMTKMEIDRLADSIDIRRRYIDSLNKGMLSW